ncbi:MAG TPA: HNH endonuclease [Bacteroidia bacterium]|nr:HNH endonuclease [Bacteroidia bacterium]
MEISIELLEKHFLNFTQYIKDVSDENFKSFSTSEFLKKHENYKGVIASLARERLESTLWRSEDIGTGKIKDKVASAVQSRVPYNNRFFDNNLIDWRKKDNFKKLPESQNLEQILFNLYKNKVNPQVAFEQLLNEGLSYQFIAYLLFIKDEQKFLPISQQRFDKIFTLLAIENFKTAKNASWENYQEFCRVVQQVQVFLKNKDPKTTLLDAHSFLWIFGGQMMEHGNNDGIGNFPKATSLSAEPVPSQATVLSSLEWMSILQNNDITTEFDIAMFNAFYTLDDHKGSVVAAANILGVEFPRINLEMGKYAKRINKKINLTFTARNEEKNKYWDLFFLGYIGDRFTWQLRPELVQALEELELVTPLIYADELPHGNIEDLIEGAKKTVSVNAYERNPEARKKCIAHWKAICTVCDFDFEKIYGEIGKGFIHVHHLKPISKIGQEYTINPVEDLRPVCPNCHSMLHKENPPLPIEKLKNIIAKQVN